MKRVQTCMDGHGAFSLSLTHAYIYISKQRKPLSTVDGPEVCKVFWQWASTVDAKKAIKENYILFLYAEKLAAFTHKVLIFVCFQE